MVVMENGGRGRGEGEEVEDIVKERRGREGGGGGEAGEKLKQEQLEGR